MKTYSLGKSRSILKWHYNRYKKKHHSLPPEQKAYLENLMEKLDQAVQQGKKRRLAILHMNWRVPEKNL